MSDVTRDPVGPEGVEPVVDALATKATLAWVPMALLGVFAGVFISFGSIAFLIVQAVAGGVEGPAQLLSGAAFSVGLVLVMVAGAELFTGNTMMVLPVVRGRFGVGRLLAAWSTVWLANLAGSLLVTALFVAGGGLSGVDGGVGAAAAEVALDKLDKGAGATIASGVLANMLVCLAVWMAAAAPTVPGKVLAILGPVTVFVAAGFEHSIANMSILPIGAAAAGDVVGTAGIARNLVLSTIGNIAGGASVALALAYGHGALRRPKGD